MLDFVKLFRKSDEGETCAVPHEPRGSAQNRRISSCRSASERIRARPKPSANFVAKVQATDAVVFCVASGEANRDQPVRLARGRAAFPGCSKPGLIKP